MSGPRRLFLGSAGLGGLRGWLASLPAAPTRAVLVPTAANPMPSAPFADAAARLLRDEGLAVERLDLERAGPSCVERALGPADLVFVTGGYAMFLLQHARRSGFDQAVRRAVGDGRTAYAGISAGAALAGPGLGFFRDGEDPGRVSSTTGLGLVPFTVLPHRDRPGNAARHDHRILRAGDPARYVSINDDQAVTVDGPHWTITPSPRGPACGSSGP
ncbi:Type 1 glutamine amidotransferase-like domain-containing protein [Actinomadura graeca]|uniref:Type 1 glutamine amidotransferase-like domain-containing protein n=1 Tax=Actinomadura graeca TaxID=2750812 RepID=A0ABX8QPZ3_9ACTN|nr:Type 1 glutamine amidotransferase-like domain-containing protein [Actinomadura graeca]QXJ20486.1 Type 1 glutamine amidotransferase-like domain-containing protein [Actinomadura graeca]